MTSIRAPVPTVGGIGLEVPAGRDLLDVDDRLEHLFEDDPRIARRRHQNTSTASWSTAARRREVVLRGELASPVREAFADQPIEDAIRRLARGHSVVVLRGDLDPASGAAAVSEVRVIENPARAALDDARSADSDRDGVAAAGADAADDPPADREAFRWSRQGVPQPTREDILFELSDPDPAIRVAAVLKVGVLEPRAALGVLAGVFAEAEDELVRSRAVAALTRLEGPGARMQLRRWALADQDPALRAQALNALATTAGERSVDVLGRALRRDPGPEVRGAAIRALRRVGGARARRYVERARALDPELGFAAEQALAGWPRSADEECGRGAGRHPARPLSGTALIIAHRLSTLIDVDCILMLEHGRVVEHDRHTSCSTGAATMPRCGPASRRSRPSEKQPKRARRLKHLLTKTCSTGDRCRRRAG